MKAMQRSVLGLAAAGTLLYGAGAALAGSPVVLSNDQLDHITAGEAIAVSSTDAQAAGVVAITGTTSNAVVAGGVAPFKGQPGLTDDTAATDGTATAVGTNLGVSGEPPASSSTNVTTGGSATGNQVISSSFNQTVHGAGGVTFQAGWTFVSGAWVGL
jgi:hypothetical protein